MITEEFANQQLARFAMHKGFQFLYDEKNTELLNDYIWAVQTAATEDICKRVISDISSGAIREMPKASYIRLAMNEENERLAVDQTAAQIEEWKREADAEKAEWERAQAQGELPPPLPEPVADPKGHEKVLEPILARYRAGAWRTDPEGARHAALMQMWLTMNREKIRKLRMLMTEPGNMPRALWEELCALQAKFKANRGRDG